jgi:hypothetical protein
MPDDFWRMSWKDFQVMIMASERKEVNEWRRFRFIGWMQYAANTTENPRKTIEQFMPLPGDPVKEKGKAMTEEELVRTFKMYGSGNGNAQA